MKRTGFLPRYAPLKPSAMPARRTPLPRQSPRQRARQRSWAVITRQAIADVGGVCVAQVPGECSRVASEGHHILGRAQGGPDTRENNLPVCPGCHRALPTPKWRAWAIARGFIVERRGLLAQGVTT